MISILLLDVDGVIVHREKYFSKRLSEDYGIPEKDIMLFFKNEYLLCATGKADLKKVLPAYLTTWGWKKSLHEFLDYWFSNERTIDERVLTLIRVLREKSPISCYLASDNEMCRSEYLWDTCGLKNHFDGIFSSAFIGYTKSEPAFFEAVIAELGVPSQYIAYWDDDADNIPVAARKGILAFEFSSFELFDKQVRDIFR